MSTTDVHETVPSRRRPLWRRLLAPLFSLVLLAAVVFWFLPQFTSLGAVWATVQAMSNLEVAVLLLATVWNLATYQFVMVTTTPGLTLRQAAVSTETTTAVANTLVGGAAVALATVVSHLSLFLVLLLALRFSGVTVDQVGWTEALVVFAFARLLTAVPFTPGGVGFVEVAMISGLAAAGGTHAAVAAGVLVFRVLTYVLPIPLGVLTYLFWQRNRSWRRAPNSA